jgi:hypothetical protein
MASMLLSHSSELEDRWEAQLRLIVLTTDRDRESSSTTMAFQFCATQLIANGIPAVLTVSHKLPDGPAREFFHTFYQQLIEYGRVDLAANLARTNLLQTQLIDNELPMVYTRLRSGMLFGPKRSVSDLTSKL